MAEVPNLKHYLQRLTGANSDSGTANPDDEIAVWSDPVGIGFTGLTRYSPTGMSAQQFMTEVYPAVETWAAGLTIPAEGLSDEQKIEGHQLFIAPHVFRTTLLLQVMARAVGLNPPAQVS